jgi:hypothetical protein
VRPSLYLHALRTARPRQLRARALRPLARRRFPAGSPPQFEPPSGPIELWRSPAFEPQLLAGTGAERLRAFHAQYGEDVLALARQGEAEAARSAMLAWIDQNPPRPRDAWHPYPLSTRAGNWLAALALEPEAATSAVVESLWRQLLHLERNIEDDILGNHVIRNARAFLLGAAAFGSAGLLEAGSALLARELPEQVLSDGGHYERSPVYHLIVLRDLLEIEAAVPGSVPAEVIERMRRFAAALARPDGNPALFNDGTLDLSPRLDLPLPPEGLSLFPETGYAVVRRVGVWLAFDCGPPAPPYLPAHAHADALSFQLWLDGEPVVVDPGMPTYEPGPERDWFRGTRAHATVSVGGRDQFELWGAFRSGPLPRVELLEATEEHLEAAVSWTNGSRHIRALTINPDVLGVDDRIEGQGRTMVVSSLPLGTTPAGEILAEGLPIVRESRAVSERLFTATESSALVMEGELDLPGRLGWRVALPRVATIAR